MIELIWIAANESLFDESHYNVQIITKNQSKFDLFPRLNPS
jgi:hypothetical protein